MANYSKEAERQNKALKGILEGKPEEKDYVQVGYEGKTPENKGGETRKSELTDIMASVRMPWFCPKCKGAMKKKLDDKFWRIMRLCVDCQINYENKLKIQGEFKEDAYQKMLENQKSQLKDLQKPDNVEKLNKLKLQIEKLEAIGGSSAIVPSEGLVFKYKGNIYKFTGAFAPINQILGSLRF